MLELLNLSGVCNTQGKYSCKWAIMMYKNVQDEVTVFKHTSVSKAAPTFYRPNQTGLGKL